MCKSAKTSFERSGVTAINHTFYWPMANISILIAYILCCSNEKIDVITAAKLSVYL